MITNSLGRDVLGELGYKKVACVIVSSDFRFEPMARCAEKSFKKFHPDVDTYLVTPDSLPLFPQSCQAFYNGTTGGIGYLKYFIAKELVSNVGYTKVICLGADTIVCDRLTEFMEDDESHVIATCDANTSMYLELGNALPTLENYRITGEGKNKKFLATQHCVTPWLKREASVTHEDVLAGRSIETFPQGTLHVPEEFGFIPDGCDSMHINADVICFNVDAYEVINHRNLTNEEVPEGEDNAASPIDWRWKNNFLTAFVSLARMTTQIWGSRANEYKEQGLVNVMLYASEFARKKLFPLKAFELFDPYIPDETRDYMFNQMWLAAPWRLTVLDTPYGKSDYLYNIRSLYETDGELSKEQVFDRAKEFNIKDGKLYNRHGKQIKVFHYRDSVQYLGASKVGESLERWKSSFTEEVKDFFIESCDCKDFFTTDQHLLTVNKIIESRNSLGNIRDDNMWTSLSKFTDMSVG